MEADGCGLHVAAQDEEEQFAKSLFNSLVVSVTESHQRLQVPNCTNNELKEGQNTPKDTPACATLVGEDLTSATFSESRELTVEEHPTPTLPTTSNVSSNIPLSITLPMAASIRFHDSSCMPANS
jgi:hypothetical protein